jgi:hypothetical protein
MSQSKLTDRSRTAMNIRISVKRRGRRLGASLAVSFAALGIVFAQSLADHLAGRLMPSAVKAANESPVYAAHTLLVCARAAGGIVWTEDAGLIADIQVPEGIPLGDALTRVLAWQDKYFWRETDGVVNILPRKSLPPLLETNIPYYTWRSDETPSLVVGRLQQLPEVLRRVSEMGYVDGLHNGPGLRKPPRVGAPPETAVSQVFVRRNLTLLALLNEIARSFPSPAIWSYHEYPQGRARALTIDAH